MSAWGRLSFPVVMIVLAGITLAGVVGLKLLGAGVLSLAFLVVPIAGAGLYLYENRDHPPIDFSRPPPVAPAPRAGPPPTLGSPTGTETEHATSAEASAPSPAEEPMPSPDEPFDDPVELADRIDRGKEVAPEPASDPDMPPPERPPG